MYSINSAYLAIYERERYLWTVSYFLKHLGLASSPKKFISLFGGPCMTVYYQGKILHSWGGSKNHSFCPLCENHEEKTNVLLCCFSSYEVWSCCLSWFNECCVLLDSFSMHYLQQRGACSGKTATDVMMVVIYGDIVTILSSDKKSLIANKWCRR